MKENLARLIKLQAIDSQLMEIEELKGDLPAQVEHLARQLEILVQSIAEKQARLKHIYQESRQLQATIEEARGHLKKYKEQILLVSTNRAYDALTAEIDGSKKTLDESEFHQLELNEENQQLVDEIKADELQVAEKRAELTNQQESLQATIAATEVEARALEQERDEILTHIEPRYLGAYNRIRAARDGLAVVPISRGACGVCFNRIPPQQQVEIKSMDKIITCESCGVILFWDTK